MGRRGRVSSDKCGLRVEECNNDGALGWEDADNVNWSFSTACLTGTAPQLLLHIAYVSASFVNIFGEFVSSSEVAEQTACANYLCFHCDNLRYDSMNVFSKALQYQVLQAGFLNDARVMYPITSSITVRCC